MFTATKRKPFRSRDLIRAPILEEGATLNGDMLPTLYTKYSGKWFKKPVFIAMFENEDKVFLFFKEDSIYEAEEVTQNYF